MQRFEGFNTADVHLDGVNAFTAARDAGARYLLALDPDRLLAPYRIECGDAARAARPYPNWESMGMGGHICGHALSALAGYWAESHRAEFRDRARYLVDGLAECQRAAGTGYLCGATDGRCLFARLAAGDVESQSFELDDAWVPLYNLHKLFAGLLDCWTVFATAADDTAAMGLSSTARDVVLRLADWWCSIASGLDDEAFQRMLVCEFGGMNESFAQLYELTGNQTYLEQSLRFTDRVFFTPLAHGRDELTGLHANTQIPKVLGYERIAALTGDQRYAKAVDTFWRSVTQKRSVSIGAHSVAEHFNPVEDFSSMITSRQGVETCNSYNMSKLAERLFLSTGEETYLAFYERVLENHIVSTIGVHEGGFVYFTPMRPNHYRAYSSPQLSFWCCVGSGLENHARYGRLIYTTDAEASLYVNLFLSSTLHWRERGVTVSQQWRPVSWNRDEGGLTLRGRTGVSYELTVYVRRPAWCEDVEYDVIDGECDVRRADTGVGYDRLHLAWTGSVQVRINRRVSVRIEAMPDGSRWGSVVRGAQVMALRGDDSDLDGLVGDDSRAGHIASGPVRRFADLPVLEGAAVDCIVPHIRPDGTVDVRVRTWDETDGRWLCHTSTLVPFPSIEGSRYSLYLPWAEDGDVDATRRMLRDLDAEESSSVRLLCDSVHCGEQQSEIDHEYAGKQDESGREEGRRFRRANENGSFSYLLQDWERTGSVVVVEVLAKDGDCAYDVVFDGVMLSRTDREMRGELLIDRYTVERGSFGRGEDMSARIAIRARQEPGPRTIRIGLLRNAD